MTLLDWTTPNVMNPTANCLVLLCCPLLGNNSFSSLPDALYKSTFYWLTLRTAACEMLMLLCCRCWMIQSFHSHHGLKTPVQSLRRQWLMSRYFAVKRTAIRWDCDQYVWQTDRSPDSFMSAMYCDDACLSALTQNFIYTATSELWFGQV